MDVSWLSSSHFRLHFSWWLYFAINIYSSIDSLTLEYLPRIVYVVCSSEIDSYICQVVAIEFQVNWLIINNIRTRLRSKTMIMNWKLNSCSRNSTNNHQIIIMMMEWIVFWNRFFVMLLLLPVRVARRSLNNGGNLWLMRNQVPFGK